MVAIIIISARYKRSILKKKDWKESSSEDGHVFPVKEYKCQLLEKWNFMKEQSTKATVNNSQQKQKQQEPDIELNRSNFNSAHI